MIELPLIFVAGFLGSSHCIGMCGPFALAIGSHTSSWKENLVRQLIYSCGRVFTYATLGAMAGFGGWRLVRAVPALVNVPAVLAIVAGALLIYYGLQATGVFPGLPVRGAATPCLAGTFFASFLRSPGPRDTFLAGVFTGMLPCGLVYAFVALAASSTSLLGGAVLMALFGLGTVPVMVTTGLSSWLLSSAARQRMLRLAAWCVVLAGAVSLARGAGFIQMPGWFEPNGCPLCP